MILKLTNKSKNFYAHVGKVFGSRKVEQVTGDRFYDDDDKVWYIYFRRGSGVPDTFVSVRQNKIKNVWTENSEHLVEVLKKVAKDWPIKESIVPAVFKKEYETAGFEFLENGYKNFIKIRGGQNE
ncbi:hypothetical protein [Heyndrickxia coagulans]|uniref:hypothetical protein n=1 Tax=Heyndrickxia coagulans TaxID=1398 RepID=UPI000779094D|nr:hypothetical protein [Heyndrickxia coagulans]